MRKTGPFYNMVNILDKLLTGRIRQTAHIADLYGFTLIGHNVPIGENVPYDPFYRISHLVCDGLFSRFLVCNGVIFTIIISVVIWKYIKYNPKDSDIAILFSIYCVLEVHGSNVFMVYPLLIFGSYFLYSIGNCKNNFRKVGNTYV